MPDPSQRQALADAIRGELLTAHHGATDIDALVDRVLDCVDAHQPVPEVVPDPPLLACGHPDNDPTVYHNNPDGQPVCAACCHECNPEET